MRSRWWRLVAAVGIVGAIGEALDAIGSPGILVFAGVYAVGAFLTIRSRVAGVIIVGVFSLVEVVFFPFYPRESASDWIVQILFFVLGLVGVVAAVGAFRERRLASAA